MFKPFYTDKETGKTCLNSENSKILDAIADIGHFHPSAYDLGMELQEAMEDKDFDIDSFVDQLESDPYTSSLTEWLNSNNNFVYYLSDAISEYSPEDGFDLLSLANVMWKRELADALYSAMEKSN